MLVVTFKLRFRLQRCSYVSGFIAKETYNTIQEALGNRKPPPKDAQLALKYKSPIINYPDNRRRQKRNVLGEGK